jgi:hypothetical protein
MPRLASRSILRYPDGREPGQGQSVRGSMVQTIVLIEDDADMRTNFGDSPGTRGYRVLAAKPGADAPSTMELGVVEWIEGGEW